MLFLERFNPSSWIRKSSILCSLLGLVLTFSSPAQELLKKEGEDRGERLAYCLEIDFQSALSLALNQNRQLQEEVESVGKAQYGVRQAIGEFDLKIAPSSEAGFESSDRRKSGFKAGGGVELSKKISTGTLFSVAPSIFKTKDHYRSEVEASMVQPLLRGLGQEYQLSRLKGAKFALRTAYRNLYLAQTELIFNTIQALYEAIKWEKMRALQELSYKRLAAFQRAALWKEKFNLGDPLDHLRLEIEMRNAKESLEFSQDAREEALDHLRDLLALPFDIDLKVSAPLSFSPPIMDLDGAIQLALKYRIEMDQAQDEAEEQKRLAFLAKKALLPELNLVVNYRNCGRSKTLGSSFSKNRENSFGIGLTTASIYDPLADQIAYEESLLALSSASRGSKTEEALIILDVKRAFRVFKRSLSSYYLQQEQMRAASKQLKIAKLKFDRGFADPFYLIQAEKALRSAEEQQLAAEIECLVGEFKLLKVMGLLTDKP